MTATIRTKDRRKATSPLNLERAGFMAPRLAKGERSKAFRVRAPGWVIEKLETLSPQEIGDVLREALGE